MCKGSDIIEKPFAMVAAPFMAGQAAVGKAAVGALMPKMPTMPDVVRPQPVADLAETETKASQEAQKKQLDTRRRARKNSLLSLAGGLGDTSAPELATSSARPVGY